MPRRETEIVAERLHLVLALTEAHAAHQRARAAAGGTAIAVMAIEAEIHGHGETAERLAALDTAHARDEAARARLAETGDEVRRLDDRLAAIDRELSWAVPETRDP